MSKCNKLRLFIIQRLIKEYNESRITKKKQREANVYMTMN